MRSTIDWNEIIPLLPKGMRDSLFLEAVTLLAAKAPNMLPIDRVRAPRRAGNSILLRGARTWGASGDGYWLAAAGRHYQINKGAPHPPSRGVIGAVWKRLTESKNETIAYEGLMSVCKGAGVTKGKESAFICALWERRFIEVKPFEGVKPVGGLPEKKIGQAY